MSRRENDEANISAEQLEEEIMTRVRALSCLHQANDQKASDEDVWTNDLIERGIDWKLFVDEEGRVDFREYTRVMGGAANLYEKRVGSLERRHEQLVRIIKGGAAVDEQRVPEKPGATDPALLEKRRRKLLERNSARGTRYTEAKDLEKIELRREYEDFVDPVIGQFKDTFHTEGFQTFLSYAMVPDNAGRLSFEEKMSPRNTIVGNNYKRIDIDSFDFSSLGQRSVCPRISMLHSSIEHPFGLEPEQMEQAMSQAESRIGLASYQFGDLVDVELPDAGDGYVYELDYGAPSDMRPGDISLDPEMNRSINQSMNHSANHSVHDDYDDGDYGDQGGYDDHHDASHGAPHGAASPEDFDELVPTTGVQVDRVLEHMRRTQDPMPKYKRLTEENRERTDSRSKRRKKETKALDLRTATRSQFQPSGGGFLKDRDRIPKQNMSVTVLLDVEFFKLNTLSVQPECMQIALNERWPKRGASFARKTHEPVFDNYDADMDMDMDMDVDDGGQEEMHELYSAMNNQMQDDGGEDDDDQRPASQGQGWAGDPVVRGIFIRRRIDQRRLKTRIIDNIKHGASTLTQLQETTWQQYDEMDRASLNRQNFFLSMLFVANEHGLELKSSDDFSDVEIRERPREEA